MKRYGNLYEKITSVDNIRAAHRHARRGKSWYEEVREIDANPDKYLPELSEMLINRTFQTSEYEVFDRFESGKLRTIYKLPYYPDRVTQWALIQVIEPYLMRTFTADTYSALPGRGIHSALNKLKKAMKNDPDGTKYCLKLDIRHYYQSINHEILKSKYRRMFKDDGVLWLIDEIVDSVCTATEDDLREIYLTEEEADRKTGVPIGNYLSQYSGNLYLSCFDHWIKEEKGVSYYFRYMDDIVIFSNSKEELHKLFDEIRIYLYDELRLVVKNNWQVFPAHVRGVDFLGYRVFGDYTLIRKTTAKRIKRKTRAMQKRVNNGESLTEHDTAVLASYKGWLEHADAAGLSRKYIEPLQGGKP